MNPSKRQRQDGEPASMARVQGMVEERWPGVPYNVWVTGGRRHVAVKLTGGTVEGVAETWLGAMDDVERKVKR